MGVQGFPTLKIVKPSKKAGGKPIIEDYQGARTAKAIVDAVVERIPNHVRKVGDKVLEGWVGEKGAKAMLFTEKGATSATLKALSVDFLGSVSVAQVRDKEAETVKKFGVTKFPTFVVLPAGSEEPLVYSGEMKKEGMSKFITESTGISPNPDPAPEGAKKSKSQPKAEKKSQKKFEQSSKSHKSADASSEKLKATSVKLDEKATESPDPQVDTAKPVQMPVPVQNQVAVLDIMEEAEHLHAKCLNPTAKICILILLPTSGAAPGTEGFTPDSPAQALLSLSEVRHRLSGRGSFPFYAVSAANSLSAELRDTLSLSKDKVEIIATNAKRNWVRKFKTGSFAVKDLSEWVDSIKMNEGSKEYLPRKLVKEVEVPSSESETAKPESKAEPKAEEKTADEVVDEQPPQPSPEAVPEMGDMKVEEIKLDGGKWGEKMVFEQDGMHFEVEELEEDFEMPPPPPQEAAAPRDEL